MDKENVVDEFLSEFKKLQDKYDVHIFADAYEEWDEDCNGDMYYDGFNAYLFVEYKDGEDNYHNHCLYTDVIR